MLRQLLSAVWAAVLLLLSWLLRLWSLHNLQRYYGACTTSATATQQHSEDTKHTA
jgi:hypothetical protein